MTLLFEEEGSLMLSLPCEKLAVKVIEMALDYVECPYEAEVNLLLTMNDEIEEMNRNFRGIDRATDVLSFPMVDYEQDGMVVTLGNWLNGRLSCEQIEQLWCEFIIPE